MWNIYTMEYYSAIKSNEFIKFLGKWMELENIILSEATQLTVGSVSLKQLVLGCIRKQAEYT